MIYLYLFLLIVLTILLFLVKIWSFDFGLISQWQYFEQKKHQKWQIYNFYPFIKTAQLRLIVLIDCLIMLILAQFLVFWQAFLLFLAINLLINLILNLKSFKNKILSKMNQILSKNRKKIRQIIKIIGYKPLKIYQMPQINQPNLESVAHFKYLIKNADFLNQSTQNIILASRKYFDYKIDKIYQPLKNFGQVEITQELTPKAVDELYKINQKYAFVKEKNKIVNLVLLKDVGAIKNSSFGRISDMVDVDLPKFDYQANLSDVIEQLLEQDYLVGLVIKNKRIVGLIELKDLLKIIRIV